MKFRFDQWWTGALVGSALTGSLAMAATTANAQAVPAGAQSAAPAGTQSAVVATAAVKGTVLDPDGAAIPGATITLTPPKGQAVVTKSGVDGAFSLTAVPAGNYTVTVTMQGFGSFVRPNVRVAGQPLNINVKLSIEEQSTTITVTTSDNQVSVDPDNNGSSVVLKGSDLEALSDDPDELQNELTALAGPAAGPNGGQIYIDGFTGGQLPPKSAIREVRINQNPFSAQYDQPGFGRIEILTKPGTDKLHGNISLQGMDKSFNTVTPFLQGGSQPDYHQIFILGTLSGALGKKASFNLSGNQRTIQNNSVFAGTIASSGPTSGTLCAPGSGLACAANALPPDLRATFTPQERYEFSPRLDFALTEKNTLTARYQIFHNDEQNAGIGGLTLPTAGYSENSRENTIQLSDTQIYSAKVINETRFEFSRDQYKQTPNSAAPTLTVTGSFTGGGSSVGVQSSTSDHIEVQNYTSVQLQKNFIRLGFRTRTNREAQFTDQNANGIFSYRNISDYLNNAPFQYAVTTYTNPRVSGQTTDLGAYAEDDWKAKPNLTLTYGIRYEAQGGINSTHDLAPRLSANYGIPHKGNPITVLRFGYGIFYNRFQIGDIINTIQQNGTNSTEQLYRAAANATLPGCAPGSTAACGTGLTSANTVYSRAPNLRSAYNSQIAFGVDQQLPMHATISATYINTLGVHQFFSRSLPTVGNNLEYQYQSEGYSRQNQLLLNGRAPLTPKFSIFGFYALNYAKSNANGADVFETSLNPHVDYGRPIAFGNRSRVFFAGNWSAPYMFSISPFLIAASGTPYNITTGVDTNGDSIINDRGEFATGVTGGSCRNPNNFTAPATITDTYPRVPAGYCIGPAEVTFNLRVVRAFGFGPKIGGAGVDQGGPRGGPPGGGRGGRGGGFGGPTVSSGRKYTASIGAQILNLFNDVNYAPQNGNLSTVVRDANGNFVQSLSLFGKSQALANGPFNSGSAVRRIFLQANFNF